jgi:hypothetical protein
MTTENIPVPPSREILYNSLLPNRFQFKYCNFCKVEAKIIIGIRIFKIKDVSHLMMFSK